jgi:pyruvate formate lyase activating enzyme
MNTEACEKQLKGTPMAPIMSISRLRLGLDGDGVTTLVTFYGCRLRCKYCINPECFNEPDESRYYTPRQLLDELMQDDVYFRSTGGGITFGGGEPGLYADFIKEFHRICPPQWKVRLETALQFHYQKTETLADVVDEWIVDVKTAEKASYREYTGGDYQQVIKNLNYLCRTFHVDKERFMIRIPVIPGFTTRERAEGTMRTLRELGFTRFDIFEYVKERPDRVNLRGKEKCELLKEVRRQLARENDIELPSRECDHEGDCPGTCPMCQHELKVLSEELKKKEDSHMAVAEETIQQIDEFVRSKLSVSEEERQPELLGMQVSLDELGGIPEPPREEREQLDGMLEPPKVRPEQLEGVPIYYPEEPHPEQVLFKECAVAGISYHIDAEDELWQELEVGQPIALVRDRHNEYDPFAVAVALPEDYNGHPEDFDFDLILGYLPRNENEEIAKLLDMGWEDSLTASLSTVKRTGKLNDRLRVAIVLHGKE